jgi:tetratricopeptide (TPR) repeat protein
MMAMKLQQGVNILQQEIKLNPSNAMPHVLLNYNDYIRLVFNEDPALYAQQKSMKEKRVQIIEQCDPKTPYYLFSKSLLYFQWSMIQIKYTDYWDAAWDFRRSYLLLAENRKKFPDFKAHDAFWGAQEAVISTIPKGYKWISTIMGLQGNMKSGLELLKLCIQRPEPAFKEEAFLFYVYLKNYIENDVEGARAVIETQKLDVRNNQLFCFMAANLALNNKHAAEAERILKNRNTSDSYMPFPLLSYELAEALQRRLSPDAVTHYEQFIRQSKGHFYIKDACMGISLNYHIRQQDELAKTYMNKIRRIGKAESDADKLAEDFAVKGRFPDVDLLRARLLNDGGYQQEALNILKPLQISSFKEKNDQLEFIYRLGRIYDDMNQPDIALTYYDKTIEMGKTSTTYFAARASLQAGHIYEKRGQKANALRYYNMVLNMENRDFKNSLDQRAKSGINRIKGY